MRSGSSIEVPVIHTTDGGVAKPQPAVAAFRFAWPRGRSPLELYYRLYEAGAAIPPTLRAAACAEMHARELEADAAAIADTALPSFLDGLADRAATYREDAAVLLGGA